MRSIAAENASATFEAEAKEEDRRTHKRRRLQKYGAVHARDMSLVTRENAHTRPGWIVTPLGRIVRPTKMRPLRPLARLDASVGKGAVKKKKNTRVELRAKRQKIDMLKHGSVHLKGVFVDVTIPDTSYADRADETSGSRLVSDHALTTEADVGESDGTEETVEDKTGASEEESEGEEVDEGEGDALSDEDDALSDEDDALSDEELSTAENKLPNKITSTSTNKLKELFAPRDEEGSSSF